MKIAILGNGQLGLELYNNISNKYQTYIFAKPIFNICNIEQLHNIIINHDIIINCVANVYVDKIENQLKNDSYNVNVLAVKNIAILCKKYNKNLVHISTDYVYGSNNNDMLDEKYQCNPINQYGLDKLLGQNAIIEEKLEKYLILRVSWLFGKYGKNNFIEKLKNSIKNNNEIKVVDDQIGNVTSTLTVVDIIVSYINNIIPIGIYNVQNNDEFVSRYDIASFIKEFLKIDCNIIKCKTKDFILPAKRQLNSKLNTNKIRKYIDITPWKESIIKYLSETKNC